MAVIVPILRLYLLFLNVFETFKTLKPPRRSPRTGEQTPRAISQRKRDMKGCVAIWLVWCSCAVVEGMADSTVGLVMPFYNEIKGIAYLFQIFTRARGAEPIYLHVMRPLVKPYVTTLDYALELVHMLGDFITLLVSVPFGFIINWWCPSASIPDDSSPPSESEPIESSSESQAERNERERKPTRQVSNGYAVGTRRRGVRQASESSKGKDLATGPSRNARPNGVPQSRSDTTVNQRHKIWHPPANTGPDEDEYDERPSNRRVVSDSATSSVSASTASSGPPISTPSEFGEIRVVEEEVEEWREYPPFPSAYPATPQVRAKTIHVAASTQRQSTLSGIYEAPQPRRESSTLPRAREQPAKSRVLANQTLPGGVGRRKLHSEDEVVKVQDFGLSLERMRVNDVNKNEAMVTETIDVDDAEENKMDIDDGYDDDNTLNITLRTPPRQRTTAISSNSSHCFPSGEFSPPPELRAFHAAYQDDEELETDQGSDGAGLLSLAVPSTRRRANSNYTLSSTRASRADSQASLTTVSRASSERTISRAPSLASRPSAGSGSDAASSSSSVAGVKRPRPVQDRPGKGKIGVKRNSGRPASRNLADTTIKPSTLKGTIRPRTSNARPVVPSRTLKPVTLNSKPLPKVPRKPASLASQGVRNTLGGVGEVGVIGSGGESAKRRKVKSVAPTARVERLPSLLAQIPEEKPITKDKPLLNS